MGIGEGRLTRKGTFELLKEGLDFGKQRWQRHSSRNNENKSVEKQSSLRHLDYRNVKDKAEKDPENEESWKVFKKDNDLVRTLF